MPRPTPGGTPSSQLGQLCAVEEPPSQKLHPLLRKRRLPCASSIPARRFQAGGPIENQYRTPKQRKNEPIRRQIYNRTTPREKGGLGHDSVENLITLCHTCHSVTHGR